MKKSEVDMDEVNEYVNKIVRQAEEEKQTGVSSMQAAHQMMQQDNENLVRWQLDFSEDLDRIYHLLKGHRLEEDENGMLVYKEAKDDRLKFFNEYGVSLIMNLLRFYLNRNTILSNYDEETIRWKVRDFGKKLVQLIYMKYEEMGMDTPEKRKMYPMVVQELTDTVHSAYLRALHGQERESLRKMTTISQTQPLGLNTEGKKRWSLRNPRTWF